MRGVETEKQREKGVYSENKWFNSYKEGLKQEKELLSKFKEVFFTKVGQRFRH